MDTLFETITPQLHEHCPQSWRPDLQLRLRLRLDLRSQLLSQGGTQACGVEPRQAYSSSADKALEALSMTTHGCWSPARAGSPCRSPVITRARESITQACAR